jgi:hypothetical protein
MARITVYASRHVDECLNHGFVTTEREQVYREKIGQFFRDLAAEARVRGHVLEIEQGEAPGVAWWYVTEAKNDDDHLAAHAFMKDGGANFWFRYG